MTNTDTSDSVQFQEITTGCGRSIGRATLNAPRTLNALSLEMIQALDERLREWLGRDDVVAIWLDGSGERALCAGGDVLALHRSMVQYAGRDRNPFVEEYFAAEYRLDHLLHSAAKPVICWAEGLVMGGGMGLMQASHFRLVTSTSRLAMPEITIGLFPDVGASWFLNRLPGKTGLFMGLTGMQMNARDAVELGLADRFMGEDREAVLESLAASGFDDDATENHRRLFRHFQEIGEQPEGLNGAVLNHLDIINRLCDGATVNEVVANILGHTQCDGWLDKARKTLASGCPQTMHLIWQQLHRARYLSLADVFRMEWCLAIQCGLHGDFREGVRALLIDKDGAPRYRHRNVDQVDAAYVEAFFQCPAPVHPLADLGV